MNSGISTASSALSAKDVLVSYGDHAVLNGLNLTVRQGEIYALLGGNGAGKSTTLNAFLGFAKPTSGRLSVNGVDPVVQPNAARANIAYLPENVALYEHLTAHENVDYLLSLAGKKRLSDDIGASFRDTGLKQSAWNMRVSTFSKGMRQKVAIAIALLREVPVLLLDEPTSGLDPRATADFNQLLVRLRGQGSAILMVTHDLLSASDIADRIGFLDGGRIVEEATAAGSDRFDIRALHRRFGEAAAA